MSHQDHREIAQLTWNAFRNHLILEYEIPKWDGDFGGANFYIPLSSSVLEKTESLFLSNILGLNVRKIGLTLKPLKGLARLRGMECRAPDHYAEAFNVRKIIAGYRIKSCRGCFLVSGRRLDHRLADDRQRAKALNRFRVRVRCLVPAVLWN